MRRLLGYGNAGALGTGTVAVATRHGTFRLEPAGRIAPLDAPLAQPAPSTDRQVVASAGPYDE